MSTEKELHLIGSDLRWSDLGAVGLSTSSTSGVIATKAYVGVESDLQAKSAMSFYGGIGTFAVVEFFIAGNVSTGDLKYAWTCPWDAATIVMNPDGRSAFATVGTAPATTDILIDINLNGTTIFTTQSNRLTITAAGTVGFSGAAEVVDLVAGDRISFDIDQIGTGTVGANLAVSLLINPSTWEA